MKAYTLARIEAMNLDHYARQAFKTPGAMLTLDLASRVAGLGPGSRVLDVACGNGEASCILAERHGCHALGVDAMLPPLRYAASKAALSSRRRKAAFARGDGERLPARSDAFDLAVCIGSPHLVGVPECWREMRRAVRPGGWLVMSDAVLTAEPPAQRERSPEWLPTLLQFDAYLRMLEEEGLEVVFSELMPPSVWQEFHAPMLLLVEEIRRYRPDDPESLAWADDVVRSLGEEERHLPLLAYAHFAARRPA